jgi:hypothetical protein
VLFESFTINGKYLRSVKIFVQFARNLSVLNFNDVFEFLGPRRVGKQHECTDQYVDGGVCHYWGV